MVWLIIGILMLPSLSEAADNLVLLSGFDSDDTGVSVDSMEFVQTKNASAEDSDLIIDRTLAHDATNGCADGGSKASLKLSVTSGEQIYYEPCASDAGRCKGNATDEDTSCTADSSCTETGSKCSYCRQTQFPLSLIRMAVRLSLHIGSGGLPSAGNERTLVEFVEADGTNGLRLAIKSDATLRFYYGYSPTVFLGSSAALTEYACTANAHLRCTVDSDCPGADTCASGGTGEYWAELELAQSNQGADDVILSLWMDGREVVDTGVLDLTTQGFPPNSADSLTTLRLGAVEAETEPVTIWFDDLKIVDGLRVHPGCVSTLYPSGDAGPNAWNRSGTTSGCVNSAHWECVDDYNDEGAYGTAHVKRGKKEILDVWELTDLSSLPTDVVIGGVDAVAFGKANGLASGTQQLRLSIVLPDAPGVLGGEQEAELAGISAGTLEQELHGHVAAQDNLRGGTLTWLRSDVNSLRLQVDTGPSRECSAAETPCESDGDCPVTETCDLVSTYRSHQIGAALLYVDLVNPDAPLLKVLPDGNKGADDDLLSVATFGDSITLGTATATCVGGLTPGQTCSFDYHCSWDPDRDKPSGGCDPNVDAGCVTCVGRNDEANNNAGYLCDLDATPAIRCGSNCSATTTTTCVDDSDCPATETCVPSYCDQAIVDGFCDDNEAVPCTTNADCDALGACQMNSTCDDSCPDDNEASPPNIGTCPTGLGAYGDLLPGLVGLDAVLECGKGAEQTWDMIGRLPDVINGEITTVSSCTSALGTGQCGCTTNADCGGGSSACTSGRCTVSDIEFDQCRGVAFGYSTCTTTCMTGVDKGDFCLADSECSGNDCGNGQPCYFPPPDYTLILGGSNDTGWILNHPALYAPGHSPNCDTILGQGTTNAALGVCSCPSKTYCTADSDCSNGGECIGVRAWMTNVMCNLGTGCLVSRVPCATNADCAQNCIGAIPGAQFFSGACECVTNADCPTGISGIGYNCLNGICFRTCDGSNPCPSGHSCANGVCNGVCTCPSAAKSCSTDADCVFTTLAPDNGPDWVFHGRCVSGSCECTGWNVCEEDTACKYGFDEDYLGGYLLAGHHRSLLNYDTMMTQVDNLGEDVCKTGCTNQGASCQDDSDCTGCSQGCDRAPRLVFLTIPQINAPVCRSHRGYQSYFARVSEHLLEESTRFPKVIDIRDALVEYPRWITMNDDVHFSSGGTAVVAARVADWLNAEGTCAINVGFDQEPQRYCRDQSTQVYGSACSVETESNDCGTNERCELRICAGDGQCPATGDSCNRG